MVELGIKHAKENLNSTKWFSVGCAGLGGTLLPFLPFEEHEAVYNFL